MRYRGKAMVEWVDGGGRMIDRASAAGGRAESGALRAGEQRRCAPGISEFPHLGSVNYSRVARRLQDRHSVGQRRRRIPPTARRAWR
jgi:hypothetical protein